MGTIVIGIFLSNKMLSSDVFVNFYKYILNTLINCSACQLSAPKNYSVFNLVMSSN